MKAGFVCREFARVPSCDFFALATSRGRISDLMSLADDDIYMFMLDAQGAFLHMPDVGRVSALRPAIGVGGGRGLGR